MRYSLKNRALSKQLPAVLVVLACAFVLVLATCVCPMGLAPVALADDGQPGLTAGKATDQGNQNEQGNEVNQGDQGTKDGQASQEAESTSWESRGRIAKIGTQAVAVRQPTERATATELFNYGWSKGGYHAKTAAAFSSYDITGDGASDQLAISLAPLESGSAGLVGAVSLSMNGQNVYQLEAASLGIDNVVLTLLQLANGQSALFLSAYDADGTALQAVLCNENGSLTKVVGNDLMNRIGVSNAHITSVVPSGNRLIVQFDFVSSVTGVSRTSFTYLGTGASFARESNTTSALRYATTEVGAFTKQPRKAANSFGVYSDDSLSSVAFTVPKDAKVRPLALRLSGDRLLYKVKYGKQIGWIASPDPDYIAGGKLLRSVYGTVELSTKVPEYSKNGALGLSLLQKLSNHTLYLTYNEIYARHGYVFADKELAGYFAAQPWYTPDANASADLTAIEAKNAKLILSIAKNRLSPYVS